MKENIFYSFIGIMIITILGILFYRSIIGILILTPIIFCYRAMKKKQLIEERKWKLNLEFRDGITALAAALEAGYSAENAFEQAGKDLRLIYQPDSMIYCEFNYILNQISMNITVEKALSDFAERTGIEDIQNFSEVFSIAKRTGGDLISVSKITSRMISDKIEVIRDIKTIIHAKKLEANIMKGIPLFILLYLSLSSPGFLNPLYHSIPGILVMSVLLACYFGAYLIINKIIAIEI